MLDSVKVVPNRFLVCGLGSLGQHCVAALKKFGVTVRAIELTEPPNWEISDLPSLLEVFIVGDCRQPDILEKAKIRECRTVLFVTNNERINIEAALAARSLNPKIRLVVRSTKQNLNELLAKQLGNFVAFEPSQLPASAFAFAALGESILGFFNLDDSILRVVQERISSTHPWCDRLTLREISSRKRRILAHILGEKENLRENPPSNDLIFYQWEPDAYLRAGDTVIYVETSNTHVSFSEKAIAQVQEKHKLWRAVRQGVLWQGLKRNLLKSWEWIYADRIRLVVAICSITVIVLVLAATLLICLNYPQISLEDAFFTAAVLLLGGYGDLFAQIPFAAPIPLWLRLFALGITLTGIALVGVLYGLLNERILSTRFQFLSRRPPVPQQDLVVLVGLGRLGQRVAALLQEFKQPLVGISNIDIEPSILPAMPLIVSNINSALTQVNLSAIRSIIAVTDDEMVNLEVGLMAHAANPGVSLVIRTFEQHFSDNLAEFLPYAQVLCAHALTAEAFAASAFGENVLGLFRLRNQTILVTEYSVEEGDTLNSSILAEFAYGYGVVPILYQKYQKPSELMPNDDRRLGTGDRLVVLATTSGLRRIELGTASSRFWQVCVEKAMNQEAAFEGANAIARISGCSINQAREIAENLPATLSFPLYKHQALRLVRELGKIRVQAYMQELERRGEDS